METKNLKKRPFILSVVWFVVMVVLFCGNLYLNFTSRTDWWATMLSVVMVVFSYLVMRNEYKKKRRRHRDEVDPYQIP